MIKFTTNNWQSGSWSRSRSWSGSGSWSRSRSWSGSMSRSRSGYGE